MEKTYRIEDLDKSSRTLFAPLEKMYLKDILHSESANLTKESHKVHLHISTKGINPQKFSTNINFLEIYFIYNVLNEEPNIIPKISITNYYLNRQNDVSIIALNSNIIGLNSIFIDGSFSKEELVSEYFGGVIKDIYVTRYEKDFLDVSVQFDGWYHNEISISCELVGDELNLTVGLPLP